MSNKQGKKNLDLAPAAAHAMGHGSTDESCSPPALDPYDLIGGELHNYVDLSPIGGNPLGAVGGGTVGDMTFPPFFDIDNNEMMGVNFPQTPRSTGNSKLEINC